MKLDPRHLEILAAIVDQGGLTEGAVALGKSQPSVSRSVAMLEQRVGAELFEPQRRPLRPTELCIALADAGRSIRTANDTASRIVANYHSGRSGAVRIAGTPIFMDGVVSGMIAEFQSENPDVRIDQSYGYITELIRRLGSDTLDLAILPIRGAEVPEGLRFTQILQGRNVIACRVGHPLARKSPLRLKDIAAYPWIAPPADSPLYHDLRAVLFSIGMRDFKVSFTGGSLSAVTNILSGSDALTVLPYSVVFMLRRENRLEALPVRIGDPDRNLGILVNAEIRGKPVVRRLVRFITSEFVGLANTIAHHERNVLWR